MFEAAGKPVFTPAFFDQQINDITTDDDLFGRADALGAFFADVGERAPPEVSNGLLDALKARLGNGSNDPVFQLLVTDAAVDGKAYGGLSVLVDGAGSLGNDRSGEFAGLMVTVLDAASQDPGTLHTLTSGMGGMFSGVRSAVGEHGAAALSVALFNALQGQGDSPDGWQAITRTHVRTQLRDGLADLQQHTGDAVTTWQTDNKNALRFVQDFGAVDPDRVAQAIVDDRAANPREARTVDASRLQVEQQGVKLDRALRDLAGIAIDFDRTSDPGEQSLAQAIRALDDDPVVMSTLQNNITLQQNLAAKINFGQFDGASSPFNPAAVTGAQQDYVDKLVRDYHLPEPVAAALRTRTDAWQTALRDEAAKGDQASDAQLRALTDRYETDVKKILAGRLPADSGVLVKPGDDVVAQIRSGLQSLGTVTSTLRLTKNFYTVTGEAVLNTYVQTAFRRGVADPAAWSPRNPMVGNAARLLNADQSLVEDTFKYLDDWKARVQARVDPQTGAVVRGRSQGFGAGVQAGHAGLRQRHRQLGCEPSRTHRGPLLPPARRGLFRGLEHQQRCERVQRSRRHQQRHVRAVLRRRRRGRFVPGLERPVVQQRRPDGGLGGPDIVRQLPHEQGGRRRRGRFCQGRQRQRHRQPDHGGRHDVGV